MILLGTTEQGENNLNVSVTFCIFLLLFFFFFFFPENYTRQTLFWLPGRNSPVLHSRRRALVRGPVSGYASVTRHNWIIILASRYAYTHYRARTGGSYEGWKREMETNGRAWGVFLTAVVFWAENEGLKYTVARTHNTWRIEYTRARYAGTYTEWNEEKKIKDRRANVFEQGHTNLFFFSFFVFFSDNQHASSHSRPAVPYNFPSESPHERRIKSLVAPTRGPIIGSLILKGRAHLAHLRDFSSCRLFITIAPSLTIPPDGRPICILLDDDSAIWFLFYDFGRILAGNIRFIIRVSKFW